MEQPTKIRDIVFASSTSYQSGQARPTICSRLTAFQ
ncbi:Uncharacterised protein [Vibrio cholerae]|nr:Uncharacterised protein [Vibrio cholerae]